MNDFDSPDKLPAVMNLHPPKNDKQKSEILYYFISLSCIYVIKLNLRGDPMKILMIGGPGTISMANTRLLLERGTDEVYLLNRGTRTEELPE